MIIFKQLGLSLFLGIAAIGLSLQPVGATPINGAATGIAGAEFTLDFETPSLALGTVVTSQFAGVTFGTNFEIRDSAEFANITGKYLDDISSGAPGPIVFDQALKAVSFNLRSDPGTTTIQAFLDGVLVESFSAATNLTNTSNFFGFQDIIFDEIRLSGAVSNGFNVDNLEFVTVPEPSSVALFALGIIGLGAARRRKTV